MPEFKRWLTGLRNGLTKRRLARRLRKVQQGSLGDVKPVGSGVFEMREFFGLGWLNLNSGYFCLDHGVHFNLHAGQYHRQTPRHGRVADALG